MNPDAFIRLTIARDILRETATPADDTLHWLEQCLSTYLAQDGRISMEQAFGLVERRAIKGEQIALEVRRMVLRQPDITTAEKLEGLRQLGLDHDESNMFKAVRKHAADVEAQAWAEYLSERLNNKEP